MLLISIISCSSAVHAAVPSNQFIYLNVQPGLLMPVDQRQSIQPTIGVGLGFKTSPEWYFGGYFQYASQTTTVINTSTSGENYLFGGEATYVIASKQTGNSIHVGIRGGALYRKLSSSVTVLGLPVTESSTALTWTLGPKVGYEYTFDMGLAFGAEYQFLIGFAGTQAFPMSLLGTLRFWF